MLSNIIFFTGRHLAAHPGLSVSMIICFIYHSSNSWLTAGKWAISLSTWVC